MHLFTSITANYTPKARVLANSVKKYHPDAKFHLVLSDEAPDWLTENIEPFDSIITPKELDIPDLESWIFKHELVELCTAVKGAAFLEIIKRHKAEKVIYFDPDIVVFSELNKILEILDDHSILLTPHLADPETEFEAIVDNEICSLRHGVFNLGFLGIRSSGEGKRFLEWWRDRLLHFCYDDKEMGLFTDQRWVDLAPAFFEDIYILREPQFNVATWNITKRLATGSIENGVMINGRPLCFMHYSGFDSGAQEVMLNKYGKNSPVLKDLRGWYIEQCIKMGQDESGQTPCVYNYYDNGELITKPQRLLYRVREDLQAAFKDPFSTKDQNKSYLHWYKANAEPPPESGASSEADSTEDLRASLQDARHELKVLKNSRSWRFASNISRALRFFR